MSAALLGGAAALAAAYGLGVSLAIPLCCGLALAVSLSSPRRSEDIESWVSTLALSLGVATVAGALLLDGAVGWGAVAAGTSLAVAAGPAQGSIVRRGLAFSGASSLFTLVFLAAPSVMFQGYPVALTQWLIISVLVGCVSWFSGLVAIDLLREGASAKTGKKGPLFRAKRALVGQRKKGSSAPAETALAKPFDTQREGLEVVTRRIFHLADALVDRAPGEHGFAGQIRDSVSGTLSQADEAISRWQLVGRCGHDDRIGRLRKRIEANEAEIAGAEPGMRSVLQRTIAGQRQTLSEYAGVERARVAFGMRLEQLESGFQMMELALERALTAGGCLDSSDMDAIVEAMGDVNATFSEELLGVTDIDSAVGCPISVAA